MMENPLMTAFTFKACIVWFVYACQQGTVAVAFQAQPRTTPSEHHTPWWTSSRSRLAVSTSTFTPEKNPEADINAQSISGVSHAQVLSGIDQIFPPTELERRNALSRTDGYWRYIQQGEDPPQKFTYGEFDFYFFASLLDKAHAAFRAANPRPGTSSADWSDCVFIDLGSGTGRLVLAASALHPTWRSCRGIEILPGIHEQAVNMLQRLPQRTNYDGSRCPSILPTSTYGSMGAIDGLPMSPVEFVCGSFEDPYVPMSDADCIFVFSTAMDEDTIRAIGHSVGRSCRPGTVVITTDYMLPLHGTVEPHETDPRVPSGTFEFRLEDTVDGWCWLTGGSSTAFIHTLTRSLGEGGAEVAVKQPPQPTPVKKSFTFPPIRY